MEEYALPLNKPLYGELEVPGDKSISHRAVIFASLAEGTSQISHFLDGEDCMRTVNAFQAMGVSISKNKTTLIVEGTGPSNLKEPSIPLYFGNSGTTTRLMIGLLASLPIFTTVYGDESLSTRPMDRVVNPLKLMKAEINGRANGKLLPLAIDGKQLHGFTYELPVKSAQVKSALLLAGLFANGPTTIIENTPTRNHTENMLKALGATITTRDGNITLSPLEQPLEPLNLYVPGDISSAAFFMVACAIIPKSSLLIRNVGLNETRTGIIDILERMGARIQTKNERVVHGEKIGDVSISQAPLSSTIIEGTIIPRLIDEIPIIALLATQAEGTTIIRNAEELKVKETDRIKAIVDVLQTLGAKIEGTDDGLIIHGRTNLTGGKVKSFGDHRIAMMSVIASLISNEKVFIDDTSSVSISYPSFFSDLNHIITT
ncbi:3-phosphoshikimate 1-carboxyvinyltransferase [Ornithinibacillus sp. L9]|uniref:3-phosphoshikimate 1-carboxyvinyltransferase n=1 Tax=Ornithinibacillus caprae TaxID=2678566 RepID=A0A6N8FG77_9BACI|nr:3-phosphoshikimate 1-carboxyvinyltransferase [Ornithinibacillus caprae]MUK87274.1 3-phosphoshikimate 1-carboxyvinyltransferase [Ornithinibacillus caprae]